MEIKDPVAMNCDGGVVLLPCVTTAGASARPSEERQRSSGGRGYISQRPMRALVDLDPRECGRLMKPLASSEPIPTL